MVFINMHHLIVKGTKHPVEFAEDIEKGMMGRDSLEGCMGFDLGKGYHSFHMKNCLIPLDIVFVYNDRINKIFPNCPPCDSDDCQHYTAAADKVYEFPAGATEGWEPGDAATLYMGTKFGK